MSAFSRRTTALACKIAISLIRLYRNTLSLLMLHSCRFHPTCSAYAIEALELHGPVKGFRKATKRLLRCNPFFQGGFDPVQ